MSRLHLNLGSNQGDRKAIIGRAAALIARAFAPARVLLSSYIESAPWGYDSPHPFLNRGALVITDRTLDPLACLRITQAIEQALAPGQTHRNPDGSYRDRPLDIDLIDLDGLSINTPDLTLPHPRAEARPFVMEPLRELERVFFSSVCKKN